MFIIKTLYTAFKLIAASIWQQSYHIPHLHSPGQLKHKLQQKSHDNKDRLYHQVVLCEDPYCLASFQYIHAHHEKTSFLHRTLLQWSKELAEVLCVSHVHTILPPISRKYVCRRLCCSRVLNTQSTRRRALKLSQDKQDR